MEDNEGGKGESGRSNKERVKLDKNNKVMISHYIKVAFRNLLKHRLQTIISLVGLSVGMACFALSALWLQYIESFEDFVKDKDRIYLLSAGQNGFEPDAKSYESPKAVASKLIELFSEIEKVYPYSNRFITFVKDDGTEIGWEAIVFEDSNDFSELVDLEMLHGRMPLNTEAEVAISRELANFYFGTEDVVGRPIRASARSGNDTKTIVGVFARMPNNTNLFQFNVVLVGSNNPWHEMNLIKVHKGTDIDVLTEKIHQADISFSEQLYNGETNELKPDLSTYSILPITKLRSDYPSAFSGINGRNIRIVVAISLITIISVLCHYFITMITLIRIRCRALALRRMLGSSVIGIVGMNLVETLMLFIISSIVGATLIYFLYPVFLQYSYLYALSTEYLIGSIAKFWSAVFIVVVALTIAATLLTINKTQHTILHGHQSHHTSTKLDTIANMIQQTVSLCILFCIGTIVMQVSFLKNSADLGFDHKNKLSITDCPTSLKNYVLSLPEVVDSYSPSDPQFPTVSYTPYMAFPSEGSSSYFEAIGKKLTQVDIDFWKMTILDGRVPDDDMEIMVNEVMAKQIEGDSIIGRTIRLGHMGNETRSYTIVGLLKDTYDSSVLSQPKPTLYTKDGQRTSEWDPYLSLTVKLKEGTAMEPLTLKISEVADSICKTESMHRVGVENMDRKFNEIMRNEDMLYKVLILIAACTLMTTLFGVFSLLSLSLEQRKKEVALRKIHGATVRQVIAIFVRMHIMTLIVSSLIAFPISYILMQEWLSVYVRQVPFPWYLGIIIFVAMAVLVFLTIIWRIRSAVKENPVEVIKNE